MNSGQHALADDAAEMLDTGIQACELWFVIQQTVAKVIHNRCQRRLNINDINQVAVFIKLCCLDTDFSHILVCMWKIFTAPVSTDQKMSGNKIFGNGNAVHNNILG